MKGMSRNLAMDETEMDEKRCIKLGKIYDNYQKWMNGWNGMKRMKMENKIDRIG